MRLTKHHGLGNDFLVALTDDVPDDAGLLARRWCHRTEGIGADGLIFGTPPGDDGAPGAVLAMTLFNSDGSEAETSGNGIRCLAQRWFAEHGGRQLEVGTGGGLRHVELVAGDGPTVQVAVDMGPVAEGPEPVPVAELSRPGYTTRRAGTGAVGNPHLVVEVDDLAAVDPALDGPALEASWKPDGINVHFLVHDGGDAISLRHWERGAGATAACGSGAVVAASLAHRWGLVGDRVEVTMPGGRAEVLLGPSVVLVGPAVHIADIEVSHA